MPRHLTSIYISPCTNWDTICLQSRYFCARRQYDPAKVSLGGPASLHFLWLPGVRSEGLSPTTQANAEIQVRVSVRKRTTGKQTGSVELLSGAGVPAEQTYTNDQGQASYHVASGTSFRVRVSGADIKEAVSEVIEVGCGGALRTVSVPVKRRDGRPWRRGPASNESLRQMNSRSRRMPGSSSIKGYLPCNTRSLKKSADFFQKAAIAYPQYDSAFDNLGVAWMQLGQTDKAQTAFERAVQLNDKNPDADRNYSRLLIAASNMRGLRITCRDP